MLQAAAMYFPIYTSKDAKRVINHQALGSERLQKIFTTKPKYIDTTSQAVHWRNGGIQTKRGMVFKESVP